MSQPIDRLQQRLKQNGFSITESRRAVFEALSDHEPRTMAELVAECIEVDRASVYRTVTLFEQLGIAQRLQMGWKYKLELSGEFAHHHHHATCDSCGKVIPLPEDTALEILLNRLASSHGFTPTDHQLEIRGLCAACSPKTA